MRKVLGTLTNELNQHTNNKDVGKDDGYPIKTFRELVEQVAKLSYFNKDHLLFFRGQISDYRNKANNSTFYPSIYRGDPLTQQELDYRFEKLNSAGKILADLFRKNKIDGHYEFKRKKYIQWSVLQHYEVTETPLLDVTQSLRVACSFAQHGNPEKTGFVYVFGLPYYANRISINSEHDLVNIRLLSITPPQALRPYFQEGFLVGTDDITSEYDDKRELDLNNRLFAKFEIKNNDYFWGMQFNRIPENALFPDYDTIEKLCCQVDQKLNTEIAPYSLGTFLQSWTKLEHSILEKARKHKREVHNVKNAIDTLMRFKEENYEQLKELDYLRMYRNKVAHNPTSLSNDELHKNIVLSQDLINIFKK